MKKMAGLSLAVMLAMGTAAWAAPDFEQMNDQQRRDYIRDLSPQEREAFMQERKAQWESLSDAEKLEKIEEHRREFLKRRDEEWNAMSNEDKIRHAEQMMQKMRKGGRGDESRSGPRDGGFAPPDGPPRRGPGRPGEREGE
jgi:hypothetical protein